MKTQNNMHATYHLNSAQEATSDIIDSIKATFQSKPITIIVEEDDEEGYELTSEMKEILDDRLMEDESVYLSGDESIQKLREKYGV
jgi:hypothetical protein